ncbi:MAG: molybdate ABC transporter permease subunit [Pseudomonadota bacterium]
MIFDPALLSIVSLSLKVALVAVAFSLPVAILIAKALAKPGWRGRALVSALVHLPLVLPPVVTGFFLLSMFGRRGWIGSFLDSIGLGFTFSWVGASLAAAVMAFPLLVRPIRLAFEIQDERLREMAFTLGASRARTFWTITLPLAWPGILSGAVLGFAKALGEFGATITFVSNIPGETQTLSLAIYSLLQSPSGDRAAMTLVVLAVAISFAAIFLSEWLAMRSQKKRER